MRKYPKRHTVSTVTFRGHPFTITVDFSPGMYIPDDGPDTRLTLASSEPWTESLRQALWKELRLRGLPDFLYQSWGKVEGGAMFFETHVIHPQHYRHDIWERMDREQQERVRRGLPNT